MITTTNCCKPRRLALAYIATALITLACVDGDANERRFATVEVGDRRSDVLSKMQSKPAQIRRIDIPLVSAEEMTWPGEGDRRLVVRLVHDYVASKSIE